MTLVQGRRVYSADGLGMGLERRDRLQHLINGRRVGRNRVAVSPDEASTALVKLRKTLTALRT